MSERGRIGLVLGGGGVLGGAWMAGAAHALANHLQRPLADLDIVVGTSAGSLLAAQVRAGLTPDELIDVEKRPEALPGRAELDVVLTSKRPYSVRPGIGSARMVLAAARTPHRIRPLSLATAFLPTGRSSLQPVATMVRAVGRVGHERGYPLVDGWPARETWVVATDYDTGRRVVFGQATSPRATLQQAVVASCSIPGWFPPMQFGGRRYVDGGVCSATSLDLLRDQQLDHVYVLAPLASLSYDRPGGALAKGERAIRRLITRQLVREVRLMRARGTAMTLLMPGPEDLTALGPRIMDPRRRAVVADTSMRTTAAALG